MVEIGAFETAHLLPHLPVLSYFELVKNNLRKQRKKQNQINNFFSGQISQFLADVKNIWVSAHSFPLGLLGLL